MNVAMLKILQNESCFKHICFFKIMAYYCISYPKRRNWKTTQMSWHPLNPRQCFHLRVRKYLLTLDSIALALKGENETNVSHVFTFVLQEL